MEKPPLCSFMALISLKHDIGEVGAGKKTVFGKHALTIPDMATVYY
jgi:hypothetical protein